MPAFDGDTVGLQTCTKLAGIERGPVARMRIAFVEDETGVVKGTAYVLHNCGHAVDLMSDRTAHRHATT